MAARLQERVALVTGASRGIGLAISRRLAMEGASLVMADINGEELAPAAKQLAEETDRRVLPVVADVTDEDTIEQMVREAVDAFGQIDILVNNAGIIQVKPWHLTTREEWERIFDVNLTGTFLVTRAVVPLMKEQGYGRIVNLASGAARGPAPNSAAYGAAKEGVIHFTRSIAVDLGPSNITVNAVSPGVVSSTKLWDEIGKGYAEHLGFDKEKRIAGLIAGLPLRRPQTPEDVAAAVAFLVSADGQEITGVILDVDGGDAL